MTRAVALRDLLLLAEAESERMWALRHAREGW